MLDTLHQKISPLVREGEPLAKHTTYRIGGPADYFFEAKTADDAARAVTAAQELKLPYYVLGGGSNVLVSDRGFRGLIIKMDNRGVEISGNAVHVEAGTPSAFLALKTTESGLTGFEWAIGLPGTVGGAIRGNASMFGGATEDSIRTVRVLKDGAVLDLARDQCGFAYRTSMFKREPGFLILSAEMELVPATDKAAGQERLKELLRKKKEQQPVEFSTAGCIFKNWEPASPKDLEVISKGLDLNSEETIPFSTHGAVPAGWLIDRAQLKDTKVGHVRISEKHANFFVNDGQGTADDVVGLIALVKTRIRNMTRSAINLQEEIEYVGF